MEPHATLPSQHEEMQVSACTRAVHVLAAARPADYWTCRLYVASSSCHTRALPPDVASVAMKDRARLAADRIAAYVSRGTGRALLSPACLRAADRQQAGGGQQYRGLIVQCMDKAITSRHDNIAVELGSWPWVATCPEAPIFIESLLAQPAFWSAGRMKVVQALVGAGLDPNARMPHKEGGDSSSATWTLFAMVCTLSSTGNAAVWDDALACAEALARTGRVQPGTVSLGGSTHLHAACFAGMDTLLKAWVKAGAITAELANAMDEPGLTPFMAACDGARLLQSFFITAASDTAAADKRSAAARACAAALARAGLVQPGTTDRHGRSHLHYACEAGAAEAVQYWTKAGLVTKEQVEATDGHCCRSHASTCIKDSRRDYTGHFTPFARACNLIVHGALFAREAARACALALLRTGHVLPAAHGTQGSMTNLSWAARAGLHEAIEAWLAAGLLTASLINCRDGLGLTCFGWACTESVLQKSAQDRATRLRKTALALAQTGWVQPGVVPYDWDGEEGGAPASARDNAASAGLDIPEAWWAQ